MKPTRLFPILIIALIACCAVVTASSTGRFRMAFEDEKGAPLEGVKVVLVQKETRTQHELVSDEKGRISKIGMNVGSYDATMTHGGFLTLEGSVFLGLADNRFEGGFAEGSLKEGQSWKNSKYYPFVMLKGLQAATPSAVFVSGVELTENTGKLYNKGLEAYKLKDYQLARSEFEKVLNAKPELPNTYFFLFDIYKELGETDNAFEILKKGLSMKPDMPEAQLAIAKLYCDRGDMSAARQAYRAVLGADANATLALRDLGMLELKAQNWTEAKSLLSRYVELAPEANDAVWIKSVLADVEKYIE